MGYSVQYGADSNLASAVVEFSLAAADDHKACGMEGCTASADWQAFKGDKSYDHHMRAHRVRGAKVEAKSPPGWKHKIEHMKEKHPEIDNPFALAWYQHGKSKGKKDVKAGGPGSGRRPGEGASNKEMADYHQNMASRHAKMGDDQYDRNKPNAGAYHDRAVEYHKNARYAYETNKPDAKEWSDRAERQTARGAGHERLDVRASAPTKLKAEGNIREMLEQRHESGVKAKGVKADTKVNDIYAPKKKMKATEVDTPTRQLKKRSIAPGKNGRVVKAGGPGSGRKPGWGKNTKDTGKLDSFHSQLTSKGFKYDESGNKVGGMTMHRYSDDKGRNAHIAEREGGKHDAAISERFGAKPTKLKAEGTRNVRI